MIAAAMIAAAVMALFGVLFGATCAVRPRTSSALIDGALSISAFALMVLWVLIAFQLAARLP